MLRIPKSDRLSWHIEARKYVLMSFSFKKLRSLLATVTASVKKSPTFCSVSEFYSTGQFLFFDVLWGPWRSGDPVHWTAWTPCIATPLVKLRSSNRASALPQYNVTTILYKRRLFWRVSVIKLLIEHRCIVRFYFNSYVLLFFYSWFTV